LVKATEPDPSKTVTRIASNSLEYLGGSQTQASAGTV
jgi:hypothetical protein